MSLQRVLSAVQLVTLVLISTLLWSTHVKKTELSEKMKILRWQLAEATSAQNKTAAELSEAAEQLRVAEVKTPEIVLQPVQALAKEVTSGHCFPGMPNHVRFLEPHDIVLERANCVAVGVPGQDRFKMCVHDLKDDVHVSGSLVRDGIWEGHVIGRFVRIMDRFPEAGILDIGAQLGMYGLQAALKGRKVVMVEALPHNANHILHSYRQNSISQRLCKDIFLVRNAVASKSGEAFKVAYKEDNNNGGTAWGGAGEPSSEFNEAIHQAQSVTIDELLPLMADWPKIIVKMDIEGSECDALEGAIKLLESKRIVSLFHEAGQMANARGQRARAPCDMLANLKRLAAAGLKPSGVEGNPLNLEQWQHWPWDVVWEL